MSQMRSSNRLGAWVALAAIGFHGLWPVLAHAGPRADPGLAEVCSTAGPKHASEAAPGQGPQSHAGGSHCLLCPLSGDRGVLISGSHHAGWVVLAPVAAGPSSAIAAPPARDTGPSAHPRAPPSYS